MYKYFDKRSLNFTALSGQFLILTTKQTIMKACEQMLASTFGIFLAGLLQEIANIGGFFRLSHNKQCKRVGSNHIGNSNSVNSGESLCSGCFAVMSATIDKTKKGAETTGKIREKERKKMNTKQISSK